MRIFLLRLTPLLATLVLKWSPSHSFSSQPFRQPKNLPTQQNRNDDCWVVVVGKIIIDEYREPSTSDEVTNRRNSQVQNKITVGGGGPQAAWGAAAALAVLQSFQDDDDNDSKQTKTKDKHPPPQQRVAFFGPVGGDGKQEQEALEKLLGPAVERISLIAESSLQTPRIQLWHNEKQEIQWKPLNNSWGLNGADSLWKNRPSAQDILSQISITATIDNLHVILEMGEEAAGGGQDSLFLMEEALLQQVQHVGIEPVAFPKETNNGGSVMNPKDVASADERLYNILPIMNVVVPDSHLVEALEESSFWKTTVDYPLDIVGRYGPEGSRILKSFPNDSSVAEYISIPAATLQTPDRKPVNPTGAGNAYSAALSTCRSQGLTIFESACIATAIGAVVCEYEHLPPWNSKVIDRIKQASLEVLEAAAKERSVETI